MYSRVGNSYRNSPAAGDPRDASRALEALGSLELRELNIDAFAGMFAICYLLDNLWPD